jgi:hypothetical protein
MTVANLGRQHQRSLNSYFKSSWEYLYLFWSYKLLFHTLPKP